MQAAVDKLENLQDTKIHYNSTHETNFHKHLVGIYNHLFCRNKIRNGIYNVRNSEPTVIFNACLDKPLK